MTIRWKSTVRIVLLLSLSLLTVEAVLRLQQAVGPLYDLALADQDRSRISETLNHVPRPEENWTLRGRETFGVHDGFSYTVRHDENGIRLNPLRPRFSTGQNPLKILFLGDSFVEGYSDSTTLVHFVWEELHRLDAVDMPIRLDNAGHSSYSPAIFVPQARQLIPILAPDLVVIVIDETDLGDDFIRYRNLVVRDENGRIAAVRPTPIGVELIDGLLEVRRHKLYVARFVHKIWHTRVHMPAFRKGYRSWYSGWVLQHARDPDRDSRQKYRMEISFFEETLTELVRTVTELLGGGSRLLLVHHPHLHHLVPDEDGFIWNRFAAEAIGRVAERENVNFYDATADLLEAFDGQPERYYWHGEMHFNFAGFELYGKLLARRLPPMLTARSSTVR